VRDYDLEILDRFDSKILPLFLISE
jgi:hypothetical protein